MVEKRAAYANYRIGKDEVMGNLNPHDSSFLFNPIYTLEPYSSWIQLARTNRELDYLQELFRVIPTGWLKWVNKRVEKKTEQGIEIRHPLNYKLSMLTHGIISLQETKYICDVLENALRQVIISHVLGNDIRYVHILGYVPKCDEAFGRYVQNREAVDKEERIDPGFIVSLSFYQLIEMISRKWKNFSHDPYIRGFGLYFRSSRACRDYKQFRCEMTTVREHRNIIAHTQDLLSNTQTQTIFNIGRKWLSPLDVDLYDKVVLYRNHRPEFLKEIEQFKNLNSHANHR